MEAGMSPVPDTRALTMAGIKAAMSTHINRYGSAALQYCDLFSFCEHEVLIYLPLAVPEGMLLWLT